MDIRFLDQDIMHCCNDEQIMHTKLGPDCARVLQMRLHQLFAAESLDTFAPAGSRPLRCTSFRNEKRKHLFRLPLMKSDILIFEGIQSKKAQSTEHSDWNAIESIVIHKVEKVVDVLSN